MVLHPDVQRRAHKELDTILSEGRLPKLSDRASLPYLECILQEVLRWRPVAPLGKVFINFGLASAHQFQPHTAPSWTMCTEALLSQLDPCSWQMRGI